MFTTLVESRAPSTRRIGGTLVSAMLHGALIAGAVVLTVPHPVNAKPEPKLPPVVYFPIDHSRDPQPPTTTKAGQTDVSTPTPPKPVDMSTIWNGSQTTIDVSTGPTIVDVDGTLGHGGVDRGNPIGHGVPGLPGGGTWDASQVDRAPAITGRADEPRYPSPLRSAGIEGHTVIQFVVDTLGRAEVAGVTVVETTDPRFADAVREVLPRYRFTPGEAGGRKVRTRVQIPFNFTLKR